MSAGLPVSLRDFSRFEAPPAFKAHESKTTQLVSEHQNDIVEHYAAATRPDQRKRKVIRSELNCDAVKVRLACIIGCMKGNIETGASIQAHAHSLSLFGLSAAVAVANLLVMGLPTFAALKSGVYQTLPGATVEERGDRVANQFRVVPLSATLTFDLSGAQPSLSAFLANAVLEGGDPFPLTVRSSSAAKLMDDTYWFMGDYLKEIEPSGTQYLFDWRFSASTNSRVVWNGSIFWAGGHIWQVAISNLTLVLQPHLTISRVGTASVQITWATNFADHVLEYATSLPAAAWSTVTNPVTVTGGRFSVVLDTDVANRFYRLRGP